MEQVEPRVNFSAGDPPNPHTHDNGNSFHHFQPPPAGDSGYALNHSMPRPPRKRPWHHSNQGTSPHPVDGVCHVKVYVAPVPRTASEADIRLVFEVHGTIVEVVLLKDKRTGVRQGSCFVKYATLDEADRAIKALSNQYTFPGESCPVVVKFADRELERLEVVDKVFVSSFNKEATEKEIEEIFSPYGYVEDIFLAQNRGYAFVKFSNREMALAAIKGLNRTFTMRGCDHPLIVRFADPKKPRIRDSRGNFLSVNANFGPCSQEPAVWPLPNFGDSSGGGNIMNVAPHHSTIAHPQVTSRMQNWEPGATVVQQPYPPQQVHSQLASMTLGSFQTPKLSSQTFITEVQRQSHTADSSVQNIEQHLSSQFNVWEKPEEYALYEKESQKQQELEDSSCSQSQLSLCSSQQVSQRQQETNHDHRQSETSPVVG
uniref:Flowering time control protein FCA n=1 Tax=Cajanus cajan TaxID=3821 RepID=A0A151RYG8_CAJCA|nr:Flowering time control protein FCA [Cajanus cajan]